MNADDRIPLKFTAQQLDYIAGVLGQRPFVEVRALLDDMTQQVTLHNQQRAQPMTGNGAAQDEPASIPAQ